MIRGTTRRGRRGRRPSGASGTASGAANTHPMASDTPRPARGLPGPPMAALRTILGQLPGQLDLWPGATPTGRPGLLLLRLKQAGRRGVCLVDVPWTSHGELARAVSALRRQGWSIRTGRCRTHDHGANGRRYHLRRDK